MIAAVRAEIARLRRQLSTVRGRLRACNVDPTPFLLQMDGIEVTQAIQDMRHSVALIAGKRTAVRVYLSYYASPDIQVRGELLARSASGAFFTIASTNQPLLSSANAGNLRPKRLNASLSLNFILPAEMISTGRWDFSLNSLLKVSTGSPLTVARPITQRVTFVNGAPLRVRVLGVRYSTGSPAVQHIPSDLDYNLLFSWLRRAYPAPQVIATRALIDISSSITTNGDPYTAPYANPYVPNYSPAGGFLQGAADLTTANANAAVTYQRAMLVNQQVGANSLDYRRRLWDEARHERMMLPNSEQMRLTNVAVDFVFDSLELMLECLDLLVDCGAQVIVHAAAGSHGVSPLP